LIVNCFHVAFWYCRVAFLFFIATSNFAFLAIFYPKPPQGFRRLVGRSRKLPGSSGSPSDVPECFPGSLAPRREVPKLPPKSRQPVRFRETAPGLPTSFPERGKPSPDFWQPFPLRGIPSQDCWQAFRKGGRLPGTSGTPSVLF